MDRETKRGLREAATALCGLILIGLLLAGLFALSGCTYWRGHPTEMRAYAAWDFHAGHDGSPIGRQPTGHILITQPLPGYLEAHFEHISSIPDFRDRGELNSVGLGFCVKVPLRRCDQ